MVVNTVFVYHPDLGAEIFTKEGQHKKRTLVLKKGMRHLCTLVLELKKITCRVSLFYYFFRDKKEQILKVFLTCTFNPGLINFHLPSYGSESRKRRAKTVSG